GTETMRAAESRTTAAPKIVSAPKRTPGRGFASPNKGKLSIKKAKTERYSRRQKKFRAVFADIGQQVGANFETTNALGNWQNNTENSVMLTSPDAKPQTMLYALCWAGYLAKQQAVALFTTDPKGPHAMYELEIPDSNVSRLRQFLRGQGMENSTI